MPPFARLCAFPIERRCRASFETRPLGAPQDDGRLLMTLKANREENSRHHEDAATFTRPLIVELDGGQHSKCLEDRQRDSELHALGYRAIRIRNNDVSRLVETLWL